MNNNIEDRNVSIMIGGPATTMQFTRPTNQQQHREEEELLAQHFKQLQQGSGVSTINGEQQLKTATRNPVTGEMEIESSTSVHTFKPSDEQGMLNGYLSTARNPGTGLPVNSLSEFKDNTELSIHGITMTAKIAAASGFLTKNDNGQYCLPSSFTPDGSAEAGNQKKQQQEQQPIIRLSSKSSMIMNDLAEQLGSETQRDQLVSKVIAGQMRGDTSFAIGEVASHLGVEPEQAEEMVATIFDEVYSQSSAHIKQTFKADPDEVFQVLADCLPEAHRASISHRIYIGDPTVYPEIMGLYNSNKTRWSKDQGEIFSLAADKIKEDFKTDPNEVYSVLKDKLPASQWASLAARIRKGDAGVYSAMMDVYYRNKLSATNRK